MAVVGEKNSVGMIISKETIPKHKERGVMTKLVD